MRRPAQFPDIDIYDGDAPLRWKVTIRRDGDRLDLTGSVLSAPVIDRGVVLGELDIDRSKQSEGVLYLTLREDLYNQVGSSTHWRLREDTQFRMLLINGRLKRRDARNADFAFPPGPVLGVEASTVNVVEEAVTLNVHSGNPLTPAQLSTLALVPSLQQEISDLWAALGQQPPGHDVSTIESLLDSFDTIEGLVSAYSTIDELVGDA